MKNISSINTCIIFLSFSFLYCACTSQGSVKEDSEEDFNKAMDALACYKSQFSPEQIQNRIAYLKKFDGKVYLRPFVGSSVHSEDIF